LSSCRNRIEVSERVPAPESSESATVSRRFGLAMTAKPGQTTGQQKAKSVS
jgi:hypothetical protein